MVHPSLSHPARLGTTMMAPHVEGDAIVVGTITEKIPMSRASEPVRQLSQRGAHMTLKSIPEMNGLDDLLLLIDESGT